MDFIAGNTGLTKKFTDTKCLLILLGVQSERLVVYNALAMFVEKNIQ
jgi:hypothetical protein